MVSGSNRESTDEERGVRIEFIPRIVSRRAVLAVRICACLFYCPGAKPVYAYPERRVLVSARACSLDCWNCPGSFSVADRARGSGHCVAAPVRTLEATIMHPGRKGQLWNWER